jgi:hypothetical protein
MPSGLTRNKARNCLLLSFKTGKDWELGTGDWALGIWWSSQCPVPSG